MVAGEKALPRCTAPAEKRTAPPKPPPGKVIRATTGMLRPRTRVQKARCHLRWHLRGSVVAAERPVPLLMPLQRGSPRNLWLGEASESTVRPPILRKRCLTPSRPYPSSLPIGLITLLRHLPLNGLNFYGITAFFMSLATCCSLAGAGASRLQALRFRCLRQRHQVRRTYPSMRSPDIEDCPMLTPRRRGSRQGPPPNKASRCKTSVLRHRVQIPGVRCCTRR